MHRSVTSLGRRNHFWKVSKAWQTVSYRACTQGHSRTQLLCQMCEWEFCHVQCWLTMCNVLVHYCLRKLLTLSWPLHWSSHRSTIHLKLWELMAVVASVNGLKVRETLKLNSDEVQRELFEAIVNKAKQHIYVALFDPIFLPNVRLIFSQKQHFRHPSATSCADGGGRD